MDEMTKVAAVLADGDRVALRSGSMYTIFILRLDEVSNESFLEYEGLATLTGENNTMRWHSRAESSSGDGS